MNRQTARLAQQESMPKKRNTLLQHTAVRPLAEPASVSNGLAAGLGRDFTQVPVQPQTQTAGRNTTRSCPMSPQRCPFGGACHSCPPRVQAKLKVGQPGDRYEQEADRVAETVMRMPEPQVQRKCSAPGCKDEDEDKLVQTKPAGSAGNAQVDHPLIQSVLSSPGQPLDAGTRSFMEPRFRQDFSGVRVHVGGEAAESARAVNARAYTVGNRIVFDAGEYTPHTGPAQRLLAHELMHVVQQGADSVAVTHSPREERDRQTSRVSEPGRLQCQPTGGEDSSKTEVCPPMESGEREEAAKAQLRLVERIPQQEWLIYGFPIGGSEISNAEAAKFIEDIIRSLMQGHFIYMTGQDPLEVRGFSDCFAGPHVDNHVLRQLRAAKFCAGVKDHFADTPKTYPALIRSCEPASADQYVGSNATRADRAQNRSILIRRVAAEKVQFQEGNEVFPYNPKFGPSEDHCAAYSTDLVRDILGPVYSHNAHCACLVTPDEPHNNCVRHCLQDKMWILLANEYRNRKPNDPPMDITIACLQIWKDHRDCYHDCGCASEFIDFPAFYAVCNITLSCAVNSAAINLGNRCMPATKNNKHRRLG
jgi:hypothetical protein